MQENRQNIQASILDRLIDYEPEVTQEPVQRQVLSIEQGKAAVIRDLENLLNTKSIVISIPPVYRQVSRSVLVYGVRDFTSQNPKSIAVKKQLRQNLEETIARFEPRLRNVTVQVEGSTGNERSVRFRITGLLILDPLTAPVTFDTLFDINRGEYTIQG
ncbi:MAG: type VI secretion system baseplate subunit TssE [bacterium]